MTHFQTQFHETARELLALLREWQEERDELDRFIACMAYRPLTRPEARTHE